MKKGKKPALRVVTRITEAEKRSMHKLFEEGKMPIYVSQTLTLEVFQCEKCVDFVDHTFRFLGGPLCETACENYVDLFGNGMSKPM